MKSELFEAMFKPKSVAVVGASKDPTRMGSLFLLMLKNCFSSNLYPVNPHEKEIGGLRAYSSVRDIPGEIDYVLVSVPAKRVKRVIEDCAAKGVNVVTIYSSGFSEFSEEGRKEEEELVKAAQGKVRIIGPNCLGAYSSSLPMIANLPLKEEGASFVSQSGGNVETVLDLGHKAGVNFAKIVSYGNACDLDSTDFIEYFGQDPNTKVILGYIEGVKDGGRFLEVLKDACSKKPVIILKGGVTTRGAKAVASHTGSLAGSNEVWNAVFKQTGAIKAESIEEFLGAALAFLYLPKLEGRRVGVVGIGGGAGVLGVDECEKAGLSLPLFSPQTISKLAEIVPPIGTNVRNPVDLSSYAQFDPSLFEKTLKIVALDSEIDALILLYHNMAYIPGLLARIEGIVTNMNLSKPTVAVLEPGIDLKEIQSKHLMNGIPVYNNLTYATKAIYNVASYSSLENKRSPLSNCSESM